MRCCFVGVLPEEGRNAAGLDDISANVDAVKAFLRCYPESFLELVFVGVFGWMKGRIRVQRWKQMLREALAAAWVRWLRQMRAAEDVCVEGGVFKRQRKAKARFGSVLFRGNKLKVSKILTYFKIGSKSVNYRIGVGPSEKFLDAFF